MNDRSSERGFVLLEFVVSVSFMAMLGALVVSMLGQGWDLNSRNSAILEVSVSTSTSTTWLVRDIHVATGTDITDGGGTQATAQFTWTDAGGAHVCDYALVTDDLQRTCDAVSLSTGDNISNLTFERSGDLVTISYEVTAPNRNDVADSIVLNVALGAG
jgi:type II secretory pathway component PulJ